MIDIFWTKASTLSCLLCVFMFYLYVISYRGASFKIQRSKAFSSRQYIFALLLVLFYCPAGDFFHYQSNVWNFNTNSAQYYWEDFYNFLVPFCHYNYLAFRIVVWGGSFVLINIAFKRFELNRTIANFFLIVCYLIIFNYARATLAFSAYYCGLSFLFVPLHDKKILSYIIALLLFYCTYSFHHSSFILVLLTPLAFLPINKRLLAVVMILMPILAKYLWGYIAQYMELENASEYIQGKLLHYTEVESTAATWKGQIKLIINYANYFLPILFSSIAFFKNRAEVSITMQRLYKITISVVIFSLLFLFLDIDNNIFFYRILFMSLLGSIILFTYFFQNNYISNRMFNIVFGLGFVNNLFTMLITYLEVS